MNTTPRTDEQVLAYLTEDGSELVHASAARELETKLADAKLDAEDQAKWALLYLARAEKAEAECLEQARLLGISGSREAALLSEIECLKKMLAEEKQLNKAGVKTYYL